MSVFKEAKQDVPETICSNLADDEDLTDLIDEFVAELEEDISTMRKALESCDYDGLRRLAHQIKGAGGSYGYPMLTEAANVLEEAAESNDEAACMTSLDELAILCLAVKQGRRLQTGQ